MKNLWGADKVFWCLAKTKKKIRKEKRVLNSRSRLGRAHFSVSLKWTVFTQRCHVDTQAREVSVYSSLLSLAGALTDKQNSVSIEKRLGPFSSFVLTRVNVSLMTCRRASMRGGHIWRHHLLSTKPYFVSQFLLSC